MTALYNRGRQTVSVEDAGVERVIAPGATIDVDGRQKWSDHLFVKAGWLEVVKAPPKQAKSEQEN